MMNQRINSFFADNQPATPCLVFDLNVVADNYRALERAMPNSNIYYAVKANPAHQVLELLVRLGSKFDCASVAEMHAVLAAGGRADQISFGNTIKKKTDIAAAYALGVRLFAFDSEAELQKLAEAAPGSRVFCRILTSGEGAEWPLNRKFGCHSSMAQELLIATREKGLVPYGVSFHVGSQQRNPNSWDVALAESAELFRELEREGIELKMVNLGGGFPTRYLQDIPTAENYGRAIDDSLRRHFGNRIPETIIEPGRGMVGNAGVIFSEVVLVSRKSADDDVRWVYLDIGKFGGLAETMDEAIRYDIAPVRPINDNAEMGRVILAGPTCDSADILYEKTPYYLPVDITVGDLLLINATGAYTTTYSSVGFNGFPPLAAYYV